MLQALRYFACVVPSRFEFEARIVGIRAGHSGRERGCGRGRERIFFCFLLIGVSLRWFLCLLSRRRLGLRLNGETRPQKNESHERTEGHCSYSIHRLSPEVFFSNMFCIIRISARCPLSTSVAKLNNSASCPAPAVSNRSLTRSEERRVGKEC